MNQICRINKYIIDFGSITRLEAMRDLGICNFGARYTEMIQAGYPLKSKWEHGKNRYGEPTLYKRYYYDESRLPRFEIENERVRELARAIYIINEFAKGGPNSNG